MPIILVYNATVTGKILAATDYICNANFKYIGRFVLSALDFEF